VTRFVEGKLQGEGLHIGIAVASWNRSITDRLLDGARERCEELGVEQLTVLRVPGALELPVAARTLTAGGCDAVVAIGTVIKGETDHYDIVVRESSAGLTEVALMAGKPVCNAILAVHDMEDALERSLPGAANKGREAAEAAVLTATALREFGNR
jgi:6,7-dimethyl-8-ribityllumazine synthase